MKKAQSRFIPSHLAFIALGVLLLSLVLLCFGAEYPLAGEMSAAGLSPFAYWTVGCDQPNAGFGAALSTAGDVNGDGFDDVILGAAWYSNVEYYEGRAYGYYGSPNGPSPTPDWMAEGNQEWAYFAYSLSSAGDVNGDGFDDVIVGAYHYENGEYSEGRAYGYHGSPTGLSTSPDWTAEGNQEEALFGWSVSCAGDVNGDGFDDVIVGVPGYKNGESFVGAAYVFHGSASGLSLSPNWTAEGNQERPDIGRSVSTAGDVNGDGFDDVIVSAHPHTGYQGVFVFHGSASGLSTSANWLAESDSYRSFIGDSVGTAGDVNLDGYDDIIVGNRSYYDGEQYDEGAAFVWLGSAVGLGEIGTLDNVDWFIEGNQMFACLGRYVSTAGDVNGDGYHDIIIGARGYDNDQIDEGRAFVYHGSASGLSVIPDWTAEGDRSDCGFGAVANAGDVNGDGFDDVIIGAARYDISIGNAGRVFAFYGSGPPPPLTVNPRWNLYD